MIHLSDEATTWLSTKINTGSYKTGHAGYVFAPDWNHVHELLRNSFEAYTLDLDCDSARIYLPNDKGEVCDCIGTNEGNTPAAIIEAVYEWSKES